MKNFWKNKQVLITGGTGFIGSHLCEFLLKKKANVSLTSKNNGRTNIIKADLTDLSSCLKATKNKDVVINLAAKVAGIQYNIDHPATMFSDNVRIVDNLLKSAVKNNVERFIIVSSACVYPRESTIPTPETDGFLSDPEPTNLGYGWSKRVAELLGKFYFKEFGLKVAIARPFNAYGPRDNYDPKYSHVIPGLIKRVFDGENPLIVWGTGRQTRSFIYVDDVVRGMAEIVEKYPVCEPVNIGSSEEVSIADLAKKIVNISGKKINIIFDKSKPDGQPRRVGDNKKAKKIVGFEAKIPLDEGLRRTIEWYKKTVKY